MKRILVSLVSEQTTPNILAIHHFDPAELLFISTQEMEKRHKTRHILDCLAGMGKDYTQHFVTIEIIEDSIHDCHRKLDEWIIEREDCDFTINLTGGTKIMSISAYDYFKDLESRRMVYVTFPKNEFITPFTKRTVNRATPLAVRLKVADYLAAYGLRIVNAAKLSTLAHEASARRELSRWMVEHYEKIKNLLVWLGGALRECRNKKNFQFTGTFAETSAEEEELLSRLHISYDGKAVSKLFSRAGILFLTGGWLEEFCFNEVHSLVGRCIDDAVTGIQIKNEKGTENEFDVMFTSGNALYTVECKSLDQRDDKKVDALYKIAALQRDFGLRGKSFFVSTSPYVLQPDGLVKPAIAARAEQFNTTVISAGEVMDFGSKVQETLGIC